MLADLIGAHPALQKLKRALPALAAQRTPLVIVGEKGVGKSLYAAHVHAHSEMRTRTLASLNASLLNERDQRIELFGGEPTMLTTTRRGILEKTTTAVLKHVDSLPPYLQEDLAEAVQSQQVQRPGAREIYRLSCRVIFTIREPLATLQRKGRITISLFGVLRSCRLVYVPPLLKRLEDIPILATHFLKELKEDPALPPPESRTIIRGLSETDTLDPALVTLLRLHPWEGNVQQLKAFLKSLVVLSPEQLMKFEEYQLITTMLSNVDEGREFSLPKVLIDLERSIVKRALTICKGNVRKAGRLLGLTESSMHRKKMDLYFLLALIPSDVDVIELLEFCFSLFIPS